MEKLKCISIPNEFVQRVDFDSKYYIHPYLYQSVVDIMTRVKKYSRRLKGNVWILYEGTAYDMNLQYVKMSKTVSGFMMIMVTEFHATCRELVNTSVFSEMVNSDVQLREDEVKTFFDDIENVYQLCHRLKISASSQDISIHYEDGKFYNLDYVLGRWIIEQAGIEYDESNEDYVDWKTNKE